MRTPAFLLTAALSLSGCATDELVDNTTKADASSSADARTLSSDASDAGRRAEISSSYPGPDTKKQTLQACTAFQEKLNKAAAIIDGTCPIEDPELETLETDFLQAAESILDPFSKLIESGEFSFKPTKGSTPSAGYGIFEVLDSAGNMAFEFHIHAGVLAIKYEIISKKTGEEMHFHHFNNTNKEMSEEPHYSFKGIQYTRNEDESSKSGAIAYWMDKSGATDTHSIEKTEYQYCSPEEIENGSELSCNPNAKKITCIIDKNWQKTASVGYDGCNSIVRERSYESDTTDTYAVPLQLKAKKAVEILLALQDKHTVWKGLWWGQSKP